MFEHLKKWPRILVVGPQRSGTRICSIMIAEDTGKWPVGEEEFGNDSLNRLRRLLDTGRNLVIQAPCMTVYADILAQTDQNLAVVMMIRELEEIHESEERIRWRFNDVEAMRYLTAGPDSAELKYDHWNAVQKDALALRGQGYEVHYSSLSAHGLWIAKDRRRSFGPRQTS